MFTDLLLRAQIALLRLDRREEGQALAEYGLILALVAVFCVVALASLQGGISNTLNSLAAKL